MKRILYILFFLILAYSCKKAVLKVESIPGNTPQGAPIYVTGNFNHWDPGDSRFQLHMKPDSTYMVELPRSFGTLAYKFTRGNWSTVEANRCGNDIEDHQLEYSRWDTISHRIECWRDLEPLNCDSITIIVESIPLNTPVQDSNPNFYCGKTRMGPIILSPFPAFRGTTNRQTFSPINLSEKILLFQRLTVLAAKKNRGCLSLREAIPLLYKSTTGATWQNRN